MLYKRRSSLNDDLNDQPMDDLKSPIVKEKPFMLKAEGFESDDDSMSSGEAKDIIINGVDSPSNYSAVKCETFRQLDYLWLFDPYMNFRDIPDFKLTEASLTISNYEEMKLLNRVLLTMFLTDLNSMSINDAALKFSETT